MLRGASPKPKELLLACDDALAISRERYERERASEDQRQRRSEAQTAVIARVVALPDALQEYCADVGATGARDVDRRSLLRQSIREVAIAMSFQGVDGGRLLRAGKDAASVFDAARTTYEIQDADVNECDPQLERELRSILEQAEHQQR